MKGKIIIFSLMLATSTSTFAQWGLNGTPIGPGNWLGSTNNQPLNIRTNTFERMKIMQGGFGNNAGRVAMGNNLPNNFNPRARLHLHQTGNSRIVTKYTAGNTGFANDGFDVGKLKI